MSSSIGDNKRRQGASSSSLTEARRRAVIAQTWDFPSKQRKVPSASFVTAVNGLQSSIVTIQNIENAGVVPSILLSAEIASIELTATQDMTPVVTATVQRLTAIASPVTFSISPSLPNGLSFSAADATLSGIPMETLSPTTFTVTAAATSIYQTACFASVSFVLSVGDSTADLSYRRFDFTSGQASASTPTIETPSWGVLRPNVAALLSATVNQLFVATTETYVAVNFVGFFKAPETGTYTFGYSADDGIELYLNDTKIINAPGATTTHSGTSSSIALVANRYYAINGLWTNGGGPGNLVFNALNINGTNKLATYPIKAQFYQ
jgi:hypothetical protein